MYKIYPMKVAESVEPEPRIFYLGDCSKTIKLYTYFWLIKGKDKVILVDTGFSLEDGKGINPEIKQTKDEHPLSQLKRRDIKPEDVTDLIITHLHWDHFSAMTDNFIKAKIYVQEKEIEYAINPPNPWFSQFVFLDTVKKLRSDFKERVHLINGEEEIFPGMSVFLTGGHTPGSQAVKIKTKSGYAVLTGDVVMTYRNIEEDVPVGFNCNLEDCFRAMERIRKEADIVIPGHDPMVLEKYGQEVSEYKGGAIKMGEAQAIKDLERIANDLRIDVIKMTTNAGSGHVGGSFSLAEIVSALYFRVLRLDPANPKWEDRDRLVLSKGHNCPIIYAALAKRSFFPRKILWTLRRLNSPLQGHPDMRKTPGIDMTTGSLGQGLSAGVGMALGGKLSRRDFKVYVILGDGEIQEGMVWEAALSASKYKLDNLIAIIDNNRYQCDDSLAKIMPTTEPIIDKWQAFGWKVLEMNGHSISDILKVLREVQEVRNKPVVILAHTVKGKGVSFMENNNYWHGGTAPTWEEGEKALEELGVRGGVVCD